jgi:hypothetical protein
VVPHVKVTAKNYLFIESGRSFCMLLNDGFIPEVDGKFIVISVVLE